MSLLSLTNVLGRLVQGKTLSSRKTVKMVEARTREHKNEMFESIFVIMDLSLLQKLRMRQVLCTPSAPLHYIRMREVTDLPGSASFGCSG